MQTRKDSIQLPIRVHRLSPTPTGALSVAGGGYQLFELVPGIAGLQLVVVATRFVLLLCAGCKFAQKIAA
jgi:hypothetical protein